VSGVEPGAACAARDASGGGPAANGWREFGASLEPYRSNPVWRRFCDRLHSEWLLECLRAGATGLILKTDLFEEAVGEGVCSLLSKKCGRVLGIDVSAAIAYEAARGGGVAAACADVRRLPFPDGSLDAVVSISTLDHFDSESDIRRSIQEIHRVLRPGGRLLITLDNPRNWAVAARNALPHPVRTRTGLVPYFVGKTLSLSDLCALLEDCGYEVNQKTTLMHCPRVLAIPLARLCGSNAAGARARLLAAALRGFERLRPSPVAERTGHFVAVCAVRRA
jgi:SAM-dependent methyltransferase